MDKLKKQVARIEAILATLTEEVDDVYERLRELENSEEEYEEEDED